MKEVKVLLVFVTLTFFACSDKEEKVSLNKNEYEQQKENLLDKEKKNATKFLQVTGDDRRNIWGKTVYKGVVKNTASVCSYKNIRVKLLYYKEGSLVTNHEELFEEVLAPGNEFEFKAKYKTPKGTDSVYASIMSASPNN